MITSGQFKWENCKFKSEEISTLEIRRCGCEGGNYMDSGYKCSARNLFKIMPEICEFCWTFQNKSGII